MHPGEGPTVPACVESNALLAVADHDEAETQPNGPVGNPSRGSTSGSVGSSEVHSPVTPERFEAISQEAEKCRTSFWVKHATRTLRQLISRCFVGRPRAGKRYPAFPFDYMHLCIYARPTMSQYEIREELSARKLEYSGSLSTIRARLYRARLAGQGGPTIPAESGAPALAAVLEPSSSTPTGTTPGALKIGAWALDENPASVLCGRTPLAGAIA